MAKKILVTGAAGFIGSHLAQRLLDEGLEVAGLDNFSGAYPESVKRNNLTGMMGRKSFGLLETDLNDAPNLMRMVAAQKPSMIVHLAARAGVRPSLENPSEYAQVNIQGTLNLLEAAAASQVEGFIFASSSSVYGESSKVPFSESDPADRPVSPYAATKRAGELLCHAFASVHAMNITCLRLFTVYGPRQRPDLAIHRFMTALAQGRPITLFGDMASSRDYTYVDDIVAGLRSAMDRCRGYSIYNLGSDRPIGLGELVQAIEKVTGRRAVVEHQPKQAGDVERTWADLTLSRKDLGYGPSMDLAEGLARQWAWISKCV